MTHATLSNGTSIWIGPTTTPYLFASTGVPMTPAVWSAAAINARELSLAFDDATWAEIVRDKGCACSSCEAKYRRRRYERYPNRFARWGWQVGRGSQGEARPSGYHGKHGKHPGYGPTGFRRLEQLIARARA